MRSEYPILFVEINETNLIFAVTKYDENQNLNIIDKIIVSNKNVEKNNITNINELSKQIKHNIEILENNLNYIFKKVTIVLGVFDYLCVNISGYKKLNGSQLLKENISYILNSIKSSIADSMPKKNIIHIFNSKSILDGNITDNLPIGLFGDFYNHELTFFLIEENNFKNIKQVFNKIGLEIDKIILKQFCDGAHLIKEHNLKSFFNITFNKKTSYINFFDDEAFRYSEKFYFGTDIILQDISKICSIEKEVIINFLSKNTFKEDPMEKNEYIEEKYFTKGRFRKIKKKLIKEIVDARVEEMVDINFKKNINLKKLNKKKFNLYIFNEDQLILNNFKDTFNSFLLKNTFGNIIFSTNPNAESSIINSANISTFGWRKEAIPIIQTKNSLITRIFKYLFG